MSSTTKIVEVGPHRIEATVYGTGGPIVVIEPAYRSTVEDRLLAARAQSPGHYIHSGDPNLVIGAIRDVVRGVRTGVQLDAVEKADQDAEESQ